MSDDFSVVVGPNPTNLLKIVGTFMRVGGQSTDRYNPQQATLYVGLLLEEVSEVMMTIAGGCIVASDTEKLANFAHQVGRIAEEFKRGLHMGDVIRCNQEDLADGLIDAAWVAVGGLYSMCRDASGAVAEVGRANLDKYPGGKVLRDENGKIKKPEGWRGPDLSAFVRREF